MQKFKRFKPLLLSLVIIVLDQLSKIWVINNIELNTIYRKFFGDFLWIVHVRNTGAAFSLGAGTGSFFRVVVFIVFPLIIMGALGWAVVTKKDFLTNAQRWFAAGILGGGLGTIIDRIFRFDEGVVDFISVNFYGLFGMDRWPTFNVSDSMVVVFVILFAISLAFSEFKGNESGKKN